MKDKILKLIIILLGLIIIYLSKTKFSEYNLQKAISACVVAQKRTSQSSSRYGHKWQKRYQTYEKHDTPASILFYPHSCLNCKVCAFCR